MEVSRLEERRVLNVAPVLSGANNLASIHQNEPNASNSGTKVSDLIAGHVTDPDPGALSGIAVTAVDNTNGKWQYSTNSGTNWSDFNSPSNTSARLLAADANTYVRFIPAADFNGTVSPGITFRAWDQTSGTAGNTANTSTNGGTTAFSVLTAHSNISIDQPITISGATTTSINDNQTANPFSGVTIGDSISAAENINVTLSESSTANGAFSNLGAFTNNLDGTFSFTGTAAAASTALQGLVFTPTAHQVTPGNTVVTSFTILAADSVTSTTDSSSSVHVTAVNNPPTINGAVANQAVNDNSTISPFSGVTISDPDLSSEPASVTVTLDNAADGRFTAGSTAGWSVNVGAGTYSFSGTRAQVEAALQGLVFAPTNHQVIPGNTVTTTFTIQLTDGANSASDNTTTVVATAINNPPTINGTVANQAVNDNATIAPFSGVTISDPDLSSEPASVTVTLDAPANGQFTASSTVGWTVNVPAGTYTFSGTRAQVASALVALVFAPTNHEGIPGSTFTTHFTIQLTDGANSANDTNTSVIATAFNNPPTINGTVANQAVNDNATIQPFSGVTISDPDLSTEPASATVSLDHPADGQFTAASTVGWTVNVGAGTYSFSGTRAQVEAALQALVFAPTNHQVIPGNTVTTKFTIQLTDGTNSASDNKTTVIATAINNPPTILGTVANQAVNDNATIQPFSGVTIADADISTEPAVITVTLDNAANGQFTATSTVGWVVNVGTGTYTFSGTRAAAQAALEALVFAPTNHQVVPGNTVTTNFTIQLTDGANSASDNTTSVVATAINNPPTILGTLANQPVNDNATIAPFSGVTISDPDNPAEPASITVTLDNAANGQFSAASTVGWTVNVGAGTYSFSGTRAATESALQALVFVPTEHQVNPGTTVTTHFTIQLTDGANSASDSKTSVIATAINNPPTILGTVANQAVNDNATIAPFAGVTISDPDLSTEPASVTVTLDQAANGQFTAASTTGWTVNVGAGTYTFSGTRAQVQAALQGLVFAPTNHQVIPGNTVTTKFTIQLTDGANSATDNQTTVVATAINNPPTILGTLANQAVNDNATIQPFSGVTISDPDNSAEPASITITLDQASNGQFTSASTVGWTVDVAAGTYSFSGTRAQVQAALQALVFAPTDHQVVPGATVTTHFTIQLADGSNSASDTNTSVVATAINNPPTILGTVANQAVNDNATLQPFSGVTISDPDNSAEPATITVTLSAAVNGQFSAASTVGWTANVLLGTYSFSGTRAQAQAALQALVFVPTIHQTAAGSTVTTTFTILDMDGPVNLASDSKTTVVATAINDAPVLNPSLGQSLTTITEKNITDLANPGNTVASILGLAVTDVDFAPLQGIAITGTTITGYGLGQWQFSVNGGATWTAFGTGTAFGAVSDSSALLLRATDLVRFLPDAKNGNVAAITYRAWDQTGASFGSQGTKFNASVNGGTSPFSLATATGAITVQDVNDPPVLTPQTYFLPATVPGSTGAVDGTPVGTLPSTDVDLPAAPFAWAITSGNNGAFAINPTTGAVSVFKTSLYTFSTTPYMLTVAATENQFNATSPPATGTQPLTIVPWMITTSATQVDNVFSTTLTINLQSAAPTQTFSGIIHWGDGSTSGTGTIRPNQPVSIVHMFPFNFFTANGANPIPISVVAAPSGDPGALPATASSTASVPGEGIHAPHVVQTTSGGFVDVAVATFVEVPIQTTVPLASIAQASEGGVASSEATNADERIVTLQVISPSGDVAQRLLVPEQELADLPGLFKKLPDGHYKLFLSEGGHERLVIEVVVRQGRAVDPTDDSGGQDRPPTGQIELGHPNPVATSEARSRIDAAGGDDRAAKNDLPQFNDNESPNASNESGQAASPEAPVGPVQVSSVKPAISMPSAKLQRPAVGVGPAKAPTADMTEKSRWGAAIAAAGAAVAVGKGLSREERVDQAMQQLDPRSLSKAARLARWLRKPQ
jgi:plastocyanin